MKKLLLIACMFILIVSCATVQQNENIPKQPITSVSKIYIFDVGQGSAAFFSTGNSNILIDTGNDKRIIDYLSRLHISIIDTMLLTHSDNDHMGMAEDIARNFNIVNVVWNGQASDTRTFKEFMDYVNTTDIHLYVANMSSNYSFKVLNPPSNYFYKEENDNSIVSFLSFGSVDVFIGGDCSEECERSLNLPYSAEIYIVDHHGSKSASTERMLEQLSPNLCIVSAGINNSYGHPSDEAIERMKNVGCSVFDTMNGTLVIETDGNNYRMENW